MTEAPLWRRAIAEFVGSGMLATVVIGSGIAAQRLTTGDVGLELLENALATGAGLFTLIVMFGPVSGAHFNPIITLVDAVLGGLRWFAASVYVAVQVGGCVCGAILANAMFEESLVSLSTHHRATGAHFISEVVATAGLVFIVFALARTGRTRIAPAAVGAYIASAYFFTSSTSFANPAITVGRMFSNTFSGIAPSSVPTFIAAQVVGGVAALGLLTVLYPTLSASAAATVVVPHQMAQDER